MGKFEKRIRKVKISNLFSIIVLSIITIVLFIMAIIEKIPIKQSNIQFDKSTKESRYATSKITYLIGPIIKSTSANNKIKYNYYIASNENDEFFIIKFNEDTKSIPILGIDLLEEENLNPIQITGEVSKITGSLNEEIIKSFNKLLGNEDENISISSEFIGNYYLNVSNDNEGIANNMFIATALFLILDGYYIFITIKINKKTDKTILELSKNGKIEEIKKEYESDKLIEYRSLKVSILPQYIISYLYGLIIIPVSDIKEVYATKEVNGRRNQYKYIAIETQDGHIYYIAPLLKRKYNKTFNELLQKIKSK